MKLNIESELGRLRAVAIHVPGSELDVMVPDNIEAWREGPNGVAANPDYLLFDDLVLRSRMQDEHAQIRAVLEATCGEGNTVLVPDLLDSALYAEAARTQVIEAVVRLEREVWRNPLAREDVARLRRQDPSNLRRTLLLGRFPDGRPVLRWPLPNLMFARDLAAVVGDAVLLTFAQKPARAREMLLARAIFRFHPHLAGLPVLDVREAGVVAPAIEGGDVLVASKTQVVIGVSERTSKESAVAAAGLLFGRGFEAVHLIEIASRRATMHLDTVFTLVDKGRCLVYAPVMLDPDATRIETHRAGKAPALRPGTLLDVLAAEGQPLQAIPCGSDDPVSQAREQWSDGANAFALAPGKILLYGRNEGTLRRLNAAGFEVLTPAEYCRNAALLLAAPERHVVVAIEGSELSRGRGGPRCLTLPLARD